MSQRTKRVVAAVVATIGIVAAPATTLALTGGSAGVPLACQGSGSGCAG